MPNLEKLPKNIKVMTTTTPQHESGPQEPLVSQQEDQVPVREITQTDRLNKRLLEAFLDRMNTTGLNQTYAEDNEPDQENDEFN